MVMKVPVLGLALTTAAFAGTSLYLRQQLEEEQARTAQMGQTVLALNSRIAALEKSRVMSHAMNSGTFSFPGPGSPASAVAATTGGKVQISEDRPVWTVGRPDSSPAFQKMMRNQIRASTRRQYADVGEKLGLGKEKTASLIELLAEQQAEQAVDGPEFQESADAHREFEQKQREQELAISNLIGPEKALELKEYQESLPARMELDMLARQLEDNGAPLSEAQRKQLVDVVIEERKRVPMPEYVDGMDQREYARTASAWRDEYEKRVAAEAGHILNAEQLESYNDIQQMQKDLREHLAGAGLTTFGAANHVRRVGDGNVVTFTSATPAFVSGTMVNEGVSSPATEQKKP